MEAAGYCPHYHVQTDASTCQMSYPLDVRDTHLSPVPRCFGSDSLPSLPPCKFQLLQSILPPHLKFRDDCQVSTPSVKAMEVHPTHVHL